MSFLNQNSIVFLEPLLRSFDPWELFEEFVVDPLLPEAQKIKEAKVIADISTLESFSILW